LESILIEKDIIDPAAIDLLVDTYETKIGPRNGAKGVIEVVHLPDDIKVGQPSVQGPAAKMGVLADAEREAVIEALKKHGGNVSTAARELAITRATLYRKIKKFNL
jgi:transcriptional regulator of acetoin/glycerol metabolism